ncbi:uncharacterized protein F5891DRAFT_673986 [Suillus fuscotomentosus]|uniref:Heterokaryon incompatibility domain-containing protein n=1 Tax=Suillus fuscotomentosus TaxID=1912939 RepID=A0AAD4HGG0_9AGAM|nr:uncharacterized protein F5891DRAFT_673986 [Suillus fuscotomentosus]KAG1895301.1 hypothetical protein F5891DRAFT_673986 [Suillus fuscotomentosus]
MHLDELTSQMLRYLLVPYRWLRTLIQVILGSPRNLDGQSPAPVPKTDRARVAWINAIQKFDALDQEVDTLSSPRPVPTRLINIFTGQIETIQNDITKRYVIASYLWNPDRFSDTPEHYSGLYNDIPRAPTFDDWFRLTCLMHPNIVQAVDEEEREVDRLQCPSEVPAGISREYLREIFLLVAREALLMGLEYVWIDSICVNQADAEDVAREIPRMSDYYSNAACCVAVSEAIRRRYATTEGPAQDDTGPESRSDQAWRRIITWMKGYHAKRLWVFQETYLSRKVVVRARNIRIDANELVKTSDSVSPGSRVLLSITSDEFPISLPISDWHRPMSPELCLRYCRKRDCAFLHDNIYGILGLFSPKIRHSLPVDYQLSPGIILAIFAYLRIRDGDLSALLTLQHEIYERDEPGLGVSWMPSGFGWQPRDIFGVTPHAELLPHVDLQGILHMSMYSLEVQKVGESLSFASIAVEHDDLNIEIHLMPRYAELFPKRPPQTGIYIIGGILEPSNSGRDPAVFGPPSLRQQIANKEREERQAFLNRKAEKGHGEVVLATFGEQSWSFEGVPNWWFWLLLATDDEGKTWRRFGIAISHEVKTDSIARKRFSIR